MHALPCPDVRQGQRLTLLALRDEARGFIEKQGLTQEQVAERLGVSQAAVSAALNADSERRVGTLVRIVEALSPYTVETERVVSYVVAKRE